MATPIIRVLCVDDHPMLLEGVSSIISSQPDMKVVGSAASAELGIILHREHRPDVTLMDLQLPKMSGLDAIRAIREAQSDARIIVLTMFQGEADIARALDAGAATYVLKDVRSDELLRIIRQVHAGGRPLPMGVAGLLAMRRTGPQLTPREIRVIELMGKGLRNKEIGAALEISEFTVRAHLRNIFEKFEVTDRVTAVNVAIRRGIIHVD